MNIEIRPLRERDLPEADRLFRLAFGTFVGLPDPLSFMAGADLVATRWRTPSNATMDLFMQRENAPGFLRSDHLVLADLR